MFTSRSSALNGTIRLEFDYDYMGRRIYKKVYDGETITKHLTFIYDGYKLIEELDTLNENASLRKYTWQPNSLGLDVPLTMTIGENIYYYHTDANKNITELTDTNGNVVEHNEYSPFGVIISSTGILDNPFKFRSEYFDTETNLIYYNYRYYNPSLGRWLSRDPIGEKGGLNLHCMLKNNTISLFDLLGLHCDDCATPYQNAVNDAMCQNTICLNTVAEEARILLRSLNDAAIAQYQFNLDQIDDVLKRSLNYCNTINRETLWGEIKYSSCTAGAYSVAYFASTGASLAYAGAYAGIVATVAAFETGRILRCGIEFDARMKGTQIAFDLCQKDYGTDSRGCPCK